MRKLATLASMMILSSIVLSTAVLAQNYPAEFWNPQALAQFLFPGMSSDWLALPNVLYYVVVPFFTAFVVIYGILKELRIFRQSTKVNYAVAFAFAFLLLPSGILTWVVSVFYAAGAFIGLMGFGILFIVGVAFWVWGRGRGLYYETGIEAEKIRGHRLDLKDINDEMERKKKELADERDKTNPNATKIAALEARVDKLREDRLSHIEKMKRLQEPS